MIKFIYFDVGGVLIKDLSSTNPNSLKSDLRIPYDLWDEFDRFYEKMEPLVCIGKEIDDFLPELINQFHIQFVSQYSLLQDIVDRFRKNNSIHKVISNIPAPISVGLLTNMYPRMLHKIFEKGIMPTYQWEIIIDSSQVKMKKPDFNIFQLAQSKAAVDSDQILYIDNSGANIKAGQKVGWKTFLYNTDDYENSSDELNQYMKKLGIY